MENPDVYVVARYAAALVPHVYAFIATLPASEKYNLISQMRRSSSSIDDNLHEGPSGQGDRAMMPFLYHANRSAGELYRQFKRCRELALGDQRMAKLLCRRAGRLLVMIARLIRAKEARLGVDRKRRPRRPRRAKRGSTRRTK